MSFKKAQQVFDPVVMIGRVGLHCVETVFRGGLVNRNARRHPTSLDVQLDELSIHFRAWLSKSCEDELRDVVMAFRSRVRPVTAASGNLPKCMS